MAKATLRNGKLVEINGELPDCYIEIMGEQSKKIYMDILPDIGDSKSAEYQNESGIGRASPFTIYKNSSMRTISWTCHFVVQSESSNDDSKSVNKIIENVRALQSACYPKDDYGQPPPICHLKCGDLLDSGDGVCAVLKSYSLKFDTSVPWDEGSLIPYKLDIDLTFDVVYDQSQLPISSRILQTGY